jgi:hypothetical protein
MAEESENPRLKKMKKEFNRQLNEIRSEVDDEKKLVTEFVKAVKMMESKMGEFAEKSNKNNEIHDTNFKHIDEDVKKIVNFCGEFIGRLRGLEDAVYGTEMPKDEKKDDEKKDGKEEDDKKEDDKKEQKME